MAETFFISSFLLIFVYGGLRELIRIRRGTYKWLNNLVLGKQLLYIGGRSASIYTAFMLTQMFSSTIVSPEIAWKKIYLYISIIIAEELGSYVYSKITIDTKDYALAAMIPGFLIIVIFFILQFPLMIVQ